MPKKSGFTLVELLVVIAIIAILSVIGITIFSGIQESARDARRRGDLHAIQTALEIYRQKNGGYPSTGIVNNWVYSDSASNPWIPGLDGNYMASVPVDPKNKPPRSGSAAAWDAGYTYAYYVDTLNSTGNSVGVAFMLLAHLEKPNAADLKTSCTLPPGTNGGIYGAQNSGAPVGYVDTDNYFVCSQQ